MELGVQANPGDVLLLVGGLGAGKTCLTQGILWGLGIEEYARSPTFVLVAEYQGRLNLYHMDLYRLESVEEVIDLALDEYLLGDGVSVVEWADKAQAVFPSDHLLIEIEYLDELTRRFTLTASHQRYDSTIRAVESRALQV
jgi:tRNA threonylcarbamoyladenosine biosynthesis protein TsaE